MMSIELTSPERCYELIALSDVTGLSPPGLHFAPRRWLLTEPVTVTNGLAVLVDVSGKWARLRVTGARAGDLLHRAIAVEAALAGRNCAALTLFDCPVVLCRSPQGFDIWVQSSYADTLRASFEVADRRLTERAGRLQSLERIK